MNRLMDVQSFIQAMPKVELDIRLEGCFRKDTILTIADQNEIPNNVKHFKDWVGLIEKPDYSRLDEIIKFVGQCLYYPDDLTRLVYDLGVDLAKQNVKYAEVLVNPVVYMPSGMNFDIFMEALNDGKDRVQRGWGIQLSWILTVPRDEPRRADEISRWAASATGKKAGVIGFGLIGAENLQPIGQFERAFSNSLKKGVATVAQAGNVNGAEGVLESIRHLEPNRIIDGWGIIESSDLIDTFANHETPLVTNIASTLHLGRIESYEQHPLRQLYDENIKVIIGSDMPSYYQSSLNDEYTLAVEKCDLSLDELEEIALNAVRYSFLPDDEKTAMLEVFREEYDQLRSEAPETN